MFVVRPTLRRFAAATGILIAAWAAPARGDSCSDCGAPPDSAFRSAIGGALDDSKESPDYYGYEGGPCEVTIGPVTCRRVGEEALLAGRGEAKSCPSGTGTSYVEATLSMGPEYSWTLTSAAGGDLGSVLVEKMAEAADEAGCPASGEPKPLSFDQVLRAPWCRIMPWKAWFIVADYEATADYTISRQFDWWVRNDGTGDDILAAGTLIAVCESGTATMKRRWPVEARLDVVTVPCVEPCTPPAILGSKTEPEEPAPEPQPAPTTTEDDSGEGGTAPAPEGDGGTTAKDGESSPTSPDSAP